MYGRWTEIADGVLVGRYRFYDQDIGAVIGADGVLLIDTRSTERQAREILDDLATRTRRRVRWFVNSHWHYDHAFGNAALRPAEGWGHDRCAAGLVGNAERMRATLAAEAPAIAVDVAAVEIDPPERTFATSASIDIGDRVVELRHPGRGHTDADIVVSVPDAGVLFAGDLLENGAAPWFGDSYPIDWPDTVEQIIGLVAGPVVPGHGDIADRRFVETQLGDLRTVARLARLAHGDGLTVDDVLPAAPWDRGPNVREAIVRGIAQLSGGLDAAIRPVGGGSAPSGG